MRIGVCPFYPVPPEVEESRRVDWLIERSAELGCTALQPGRVPTDPDDLKRLRELAESKDIELESYAQGIWGLSGTDAKASREQLLQSIKIAKGLGTKLIRTGYGRLNVETSRFNKEVPLAEHLGHLIENLKAAASIVEDHGILLAIENHCDFMGTQMAEVFEAVDSPNVGAALDTANGYTVFCDPMDDARALARFTITTHLKDMKIIDIREPNRIPMIPVGCDLGDGNVGIAEVVRVMAEESPHAEGLHLIIETGWMPPPAPDMPQNQQILGVFHRSIDYLKELLQSS